MSFGTRGFKSHSRRLSYETNTSIQVKVMIAVNANITLDCLFRLFKVSQKTITIMTKLY